jgi:hypothetical protein
MKKKKFDVVWEEVIRFSAVVEAESEEEAEEIALQSTPEEEKREEYIRTIDDSIQVTEIE